MQDLLSLRLSSLFQPGSTPEARKTLKCELLDLAKVCQVVPQNEFLLRTVANTLTPAVHLVFGAASLILVLTETCRRQVYFAVIAQLQNSGQLDALEGDETKRVALLEKLILASSTDLIAEYYGSCPKGFLRLLARLGDSARGAELYADLFTLVSEVPGLALQLLSVTQGSTLADGMVELLMEMPRSSQAVPLAQSFDSIYEFQRFMEVYRIVLGEPELRADHIGRICAGEKTARILEEAYLEIPFAEPVISALGLRHVQNGTDLVGVSRTFKNCLHAFVAESLKGAHQYYVWTKKGAPAVVLCLQNEAPFGWYLSEAKLAENQHLPRTLRKELHALLEHCGVRTGGSLEAMIRPYRQQEDVMEFEDMFDFNAA